MQQRGRKSSAALAVVETASDRAVTRFERLPMPAGMSQAQAAVWKRTVDSLPGDWFGTSDGPLLVQYCRWVVEADALQAKKDELPQDALETETGLRYYERISRMHANATAAIVSLATKMRLTPHSRYGPKKAHRMESQGAKRPWEE